MRAHYRVGYWLAAMALLGFITSAGKLPSGWMLPGGGVKVSSAVYAKAAPKFCALTFDDGPNGTYMPQVQRVLDEAGVKATFFLIGQRIPTNAKAVQALAAAGHELANHSWSHPEFTKLSEAQQRQQIAKCQHAIEALGLEAAWFRPPYGYYNRATVRAAGSQKLETVLWSVDPQDWAKPGAERIRNRVNRGVGNGAVVLLHCTNAQTVEALPGIIKHLRDAGYTFVTMSDWRVAATTGKLPAPKLVAKQAAAAQPAEAAGLPAPAAGWAAPFGTQELAPADALAPAELPGDSVLEGEGARTIVTDNGHAAEATTPPVQPPAAPAPPATPAAPPAKAAQRLSVFANFSDPVEAWEIWRSERSGQLRRCLGIAAPLLGVGPTGEVVDTALTPAADVPALGGGPADAGATPAEAGGQVVATTREQPATARSEAAPAPRSGAEPAVTLPPLEQRKPLDFRIVDLVDFTSPLTQWQPPAAIDTSAFGFTPPPQLEGGLLPGAQFYFLSLAPNIEDYTWVELDTTVRLGKLAGLVLANEFVYYGPESELPYPWAFHCYADLDRGAMLDLTVETAADVIDAIAKGKPNIFVVVRPENLNFFITAHTLAEMGPGLRDFILLRQATAGLPYDPAGALAEYWRLPAGVQLARFTDGTRTALVLYSHERKPHAVAIPPEFAYFSRVTIDAGGWLRVARNDEVVVNVDLAPVVLYYEYAAQ